MRDMAHTNGIESFWALMDRGIMGNFHHVSQPDSETYVGQHELSHSIPADLVRMYEGLKTHLEAEILSVDHLKQGVTVTCTLQDVAAFIGVLPKLAEINKWSFSLS